MAMKRVDKEYVFSLEQLVKATLESSIDGILVVTNDGRIIDYNQKFMNMWHIPKKLLDTKDENKALEYVQVQLDDPDDFLTNIKLLYQKPNAVSVDVLRFKDGRIYERYSHPYMSNETPIGRIWSFRDITRRTKLEEEIEFHNTHDGLTGLPNRLYLFDRMREAIYSANEGNNHFALFVFDLDRFKLINDSLTHAVGDELLRAVGRRLSSVLRKGDTIARIGSDEFVVIATDLEHQDQAGAMARNLLEVVSRPFKIADREIAITASVGISLYPKDGDTVDILLRNADTAVYRAKENGLNRFAFYTTEMNSQALARLDQEMQLRYAILNNEFVLHYQPQFNTVTRDLIGVEALIRWQHPEKGLLPPQDFIPLAEETGLIVPIGEWVLKEACQQAKKWQLQGLPFFRIAVNVSEEQLKQHDFVETIVAILQETGLDAHYLELEITENALIKTAAIINIIASLKKLGIEITLDDFGTGYSSLSYLKKVPLNRLKIDRSFIQNIPDGINDVELVRAIIAMGKAFHLAILAEGIEKESQLTFLTTERCNEVQGFYFSQPLSTEEFEQYLLTCPVQKKSLE